MAHYTRLIDDTTLTADEAEHELQTNNPPRNQEDANWNKRYADLRSYSQKQKDEADKKIKALESQLADATRKTISLPTSPEQVADWAKRYPDVAKIVETIAIQKTSEQTDEINRRLQDIQEKEVTNTRREAQLRLAEKHPDFFDDIRHREDFHSWLASKSKRTQDVIYGDDYDADAAVDVITSYKLENAGPKRKKTDPASAAMGVRSRDNPRVSPRGGNDPIFSESQIAKMSTAEYTRYEKEIDEAIRDGRFEYDLSGGAR